MRPDGGGVATLSEQARQRWQSAAFRATEAMLAGGDTHELLQRVAATASELVDGDVATLGVPHDPGRSLTLQVAVGYRAEDLQGAVFPVSESLSGAVISSLEPLLLRDATSARNAYQPICELGDMGPTLVVPLMTGDGAFGTLLVARRRGRPQYQDDDLRLLHVFADHVALAIEFSRSRAENERLAVLEERERIARDLHDAVIQRLFAAGLRLESLAAGWDEPTSTELQAIVNSLDETLRDIRSTIFDRSADG
jgi:signal transduction histidine kinase